MKYRVIIADDEEVARLRLRRLLLNFPEYEVIAESADGISAKESIEKAKPDLVFLDIEMPGMTGIEVAKEACKNIFVIFITAYNQYALDAFKALAIDYVLKPISDNDLKTALEKFSIVAKPQDFNRLFEQFSHQLKPQNRLNRIKVSVGDSVKLISLNEIICFEADQKYTSVFTLDSTYVTDQSLRELESILPGEDFMRIHRSHIVNVNMISEIKRIEDRQCKLILKVPFSKELIVSRNYVDRVLEI